MIASDQIAVFAAKAIAAAGKVYELVDPVTGEVRSCPGIWQAIDNKRTDLEGGNGQKRDGAKTYMFKTCPTGPTFPAPGERLEEVGGTWEIGRPFRKGFFLVHPLKRVD